MSVIDSLISVFLDPLALASDFGDIILFCQPDITVLRVTYMLIFSFTPRALDNFVTTAGSGTTFPVS